MSVTIKKKKPVYGVKPGVRGPNKENRKPVAPESIVVVNEHDGRHNNFRTPIEKYNSEVLSVADKDPRDRTSRVGKDLQKLIRQVGDEVIDPQTGWTRIVAIIRKLYVLSLGGDVRAMSLLFERGWGKPIVPVQVDVRTELRQIVQETNLSPEDIQGDPVLRELFSEEESLELVAAPGSPDHYAVAKRAGEDKLVRPVSVSPDADQLSESSGVVEDGGRA